MTTYQEALCQLETEWNDLELSLPSPCDFAGEWIVSHPTHLLIQAYRLARLPLLTRELWLKSVNEMTVAYPSLSPLDLEIKLWTLMQAWNIRLY